MTEEDKKLIRTFEAKLRHFMFLYEGLGQENERLRQQLAEKDKQIARLEVGQKELEVRFTNLKMARTLSLYDKDIKDAKQRLTSLVREVDRCIALLNE
ncbi:MAG: hypothetical protein IJ456_05905 [Bacteroides sp.]|nr:hypothetical protein [Bacteroides sp.]